MWINRKINYLIKSISCQNKVISYNKLIQVRKNKQLDKFTFLLKVNSLTTPSTFENYIILFYN